MHRLHRIVATGITIMALTSGAGAQTLLNSLEVQRLVDRADASSHAALQRHFELLADRYTSDAKQYRAMARGFIGNPNRLTTPPPGWHCLRAAEESDLAAATVRALARYHAQRAIDVIAPMPPGAAPYESGRGAPRPTPGQVRALEREARTVADHRFLEEYFDNLATASLAVVAQHSAMAAAASALGTRSTAYQREQCERVIRAARRAVDDAVAAATRHHQLAALG
jgi:hypothetical protein